MWDNFDFKPLQSESSNVPYGFEDEGTEIIKFREGHILKLKNEGWSESDKWEAQQQRSEYIWSLNNEQMSDNTRVTLRGYIEELTEIINS
jgi:hypothetical protein